MSNDGILEAKKILVEFMEWTIEPGIEGEKNPFYNQPYKKGFIPNMILLSDLPFDTSWEWLIPVADKFCKLKYTYPTKKHYHKQVVTALKNGITTFDIGNAFNDVVMAVKWYKENKVE